MEIALSILGGLAVLVVGAEFLVRGAVRLAERMGVSPLLIGLTIVGFGTSTPELVTSVKGALAGSPGIAVGNIVGSNLFNVLVILAIAAMIHPLAVSSSALKRDGVLVIVASALFVAVGHFWMLDRAVGFAFVAMLAGYLYYAYLQERVSATEGHTAAFEKGEALEGADPATRPGDAQHSPLVSSAFVLLGLVGLVVGGSYFVDGSIALARSLGISETVIGLTVVAAGTSMPELATSAIAALRKQTDVAIGNILGSNVYNLFGIGGVTALISPTPIPPEIVAFDGWILLGTAVILVGLMYTGRIVSRAEGAILFAGYLAYLWIVWPD